MTCFPSSTDLKENCREASEGTSVPTSEHLRGVHNFERLAYSVLKCSAQLSVYSCIKSSVMLSYRKMTYVQIFIAKHC